MTTELTEQQPIAAENRFTMTKELFQEGCGAIFSRKHQKIMIFFGAGIAVMGALFLIIQLGFHRELMMGIPLLLLGIGTVIWALCLPRMDRSRKWKAYKLKCGGRFERTAVFYEDRIEIPAQDGSVLEVPYSEVNNVLETAHLWVLLCDGKKGIMLEKSSFTQGSFSDVKALLTDE